MPRRLGQHFLKAAGVARIVEAIAPGSGDSFLEIGPGKGALTLALAPRVARVVAVELDHSLGRRLMERAPANVEVVLGDALDVDLGGFRCDRLCGNLPYYVSSPLLRRLLELKSQARDLHVMLQADVADRVAAPPGSKEYGVLSVLFGLWADVDIPARFGRASFDPPPKVDSALLRARFRKEPRAAVADPAAFEKLVKTAFRHRRKTLENNLQDSYPNLKDYLRLLKIEGRRRAETLSVVEFAALAASLQG